MAKPKVYTLKEQATKWVLLDPNKKPVFSVPLREIGKCSISPYLHPRSS